MNLMEVAIAELGSKRSIRAVAQQLSKSTSLIKRWSRRWQWPKRVRAHTQQLTQAKDKKLAEELADLMCRDEVIARTSMLARTDIGLLFDEKGEFDVAEAKKRGLSYLLSGLKIVRTTYPNGTVRETREIKIDARLKALEMLARHHQLCRAREP